MMSKCVLDWTKLDEFGLFTDRMNIEALNNRVRNRDNELNFNIKQHIYTKSESIGITIRFTLCLLYGHAIHDGLLFQTFQTFQMKFEYKHQ